MKIEAKYMNEKIKKLVENNPDLAAYISSIESENQTLKQTVENLTFRLSKMNRTVFGSTSEKSKHVEEELNLFNMNEAEQHQNLNASEPEIEKVTKRKNRKSRNENISRLETEHIVYKLSEENCKCDDCGSTLKVVGTDNRETVKIMKKAIKVLEENTVYSCPKCETITKANMPKLPIQKGIAQPSLLAQVIVDKMANALPLYRQSEDYKRIGLNLSRQNLSNWMIKSSDLLEVIYEKMKLDLLSDDVIHCDETTLQVLKESGKKASTKSYMWAYTSSRYSNNISLFEYQSSRAGSHAKEFLTDFEGYIHVDGYKGYDQVDNVIKIYCFAHLRRKFEQLYKSLPKDIKAGSNTEIALNYCNEIYRLDQKSRELSVEERLKFKQESIEPMMIEFKKWLNEKTLTAAGNTPYGDAIGYAVKHIDGVMNYLKDGRLDIDNNRCENSIRPFVIGRRNWLFSNTPNGAKSSATLYSIVQTCIINEINPYQYLEEVLSVLANTKINDLNLNSIMPYSEGIKTKYKM